MKRLLKIAEIGEKVLNRKAKIVKDVEDLSVQDLIGDMLATLEETGGVGLSAPQVYQSLKIAVIHSFPSANRPEAPDFGPEVFINPEITNKSSETEKDWEGCLSMPGLRANIDRAKEITVKYENQKGLKKTAKFNGFLARILQHEIDHFDGYLWIDRVNNSKEIISENIYRKMIKMLK